MTFKFETKVERADQKFRDNLAHNSALLDQYGERLATAKGGGGPETIQKHKGRGKLLARERIAGLMDAGADFLELSPLAAWDMYENQSPGAGIVTGIGRVSGVTCMIIAN